MGSCWGERRRSSRRERACAGRQGSWGCAIRRCGRTCGKACCRGSRASRERLQALPAPLRNLLDTLRLIAYRAETAMAGAVAPELSRPETVRPLLKALFRSDASLLPDPAAGTLTVRLLHQASRGLDAALAALLKELNETATLFPGTDLRLVYEILPHNPLPSTVAPTLPEPASPPAIMPT